MLRLTIRKGPEELQTVELGPGKHLVGRKDDCAVVLPDHDVSSVHAQIEVGDREVVVKDMESLNGVFSRGKKIGKTTFTRDVDFDISGYSFKGRFEPVKKSIGLPSFTLPGLRILVPAVLLVVALGTLCSFWLAATVSSRQDARRESLRRGALLARSLAEQNTCPLRAKLTDQVRVTPISAEDGVRSAFVADQTGKVLAPSQSLGKMLDHPKVAEALRQGLTTLYDGPGGEIVLASPIKDAEGVLGVAVVNFMPAGGLFGPSRFGPPLLGFLAALALALAGAWLVLRTIRSQIGGLSENVCLALKTDKRSLDLDDLDPELVPLGQEVERLLLLPKVQEAAPAAPAPPRPPQAAPESAEESPQAVLDLETQPGPCFLLDLGEYRILAWNTAFGPLAAPEATPPVHLLRGLADPDHLSSVLSLLESPDAPNEAILAGSFAAVAKIPAGQGRVLFLFTRSNHG